MNNLIGPGLCIVALCVMLQACYVSNSDVEKAVEKASITHIENKLRSEHRSLRLALVVQEGDLSKIHIKCTPMFKAAALKSDLVKTLDDAFIRDTSDPKFFNYHACVEASIRKTKLGRSNMELVASNRQIKKIAEHPDYAKRMKELWNKGALSYGELGKILYFSFELESLSGLASHKSN